MTDKLNPRTAAAGATPGDQPLRRKSSGEADQAATRKHQIQRRVTDGMPDFDAMSDSAMLRARDMVRSPKHPNRPTILPFSLSSLDRKVAAGDFPKPVKLGPKTTAWPVGAVRKWLADQQAAMA